MEVVEILPPPPPCHATEQPSGARSAQRIPSTTGDRQHMSCFSYFWRSRRLEYLQRVAQVSATQLPLCCSQQDGKFPPKSCLLFFFFPAAAEAFSRRKGMVDHTARCSHSLGLILLPVHHGSCGPTRETRSLLSDAKCCSRGPAIEILITCPNGQAERANYFWDNIATTRETTFLMYWFLSGLKSDVSGQQCGLQGQEVSPGKVRAAEESSEQHRRVWEEPGCGGICPVFCFKRPNWGGEVNLWKKGVFKLTERK